MAPRPDRFLVWGAGGHGRVIADLIRARGNDVVGFVDGDAAKVGEGVEHGGARVVHHEQELFERIAASGAYPDGIDALALGIGDNHARLRGLSLLRELCVPHLLHPSAVVSPSASFGRGAVVFAGAVVNAGARVGDAAIINSGAVIEHDCTVAEGAHVSPNATLAGGVRVGARSWVGAGATVIQGIVIGDDVIVGAGAVVIRAVPDGAKVVGVPAAPRDR